MDLRWHGPRAELSKESKNDLCPPQLAFVLEIPHAAPDQAVTEGRCITTEGSRRVIISLSMIDLDFKRLQSGQKVLLRYHTAG